MIDVRKVRDEVLDALAGLPIAAAWLYETLSHPGIAVAILPTEPITAWIQLELGRDLRWTARTERFITYLPDCSPQHAELIVRRGVLILDRDPAVREQYVRDVLERAAEITREREAIARGLEALRKEIPVT